MGAVLIGDVRVEDGKLAGSVVIENFWHRDVDDLPCAGGMRFVSFVHPRKLESLAIIAESDIISRQVFPHRTGFGIILRNERTVRAHRVAAAWRTAVLLERPSDRIGHLH